MCSRNIAEGDRMSMGLRPAARLNGVGVPRLVPRSRVVPASRALVIAVAGISMLLASCEGGANLPEPSRSLSIPTPSRTVTVPSPSRTRTPAPTASDVPTTTTSPSSVEPHGNLPRHGDGNDVDDVTARARLGVDRSGGELLDDRLALGPSRSRGARRRGCLRDPIETYGRGGRPPPSPPGVRGGDGAP